VRTAFLLNCGAAVVALCSSRVSVSARLPCRSDSRRKIEHGTPQPVSCGCFTASPAPHGAFGGVAIAFLWELPNRESQLTQGSKGRR